MVWQIYIAIPFIFGDDTNFWEVPMIIIRLILTGKSDKIRNDWDASHMGTFLGGETGWREYIRVSKIFGGDGTGKPGWGA